MSSDTDGVDLRLVGCAALIQLAGFLMLQKHGLLDLLTVLQYWMALL